MWSINTGDRDEQTKAQIIKLVYLWRYFVQNDRREKEQLKAELL